MASVAKRLRQRIVVPPSVGSNPIARPRERQLRSLALLILESTRLAVATVTKSYS
jgi:hypothetical protein